MNIIENYKLAVEAITMDDLIANWPTIIEMHGLTPERATAIERLAIDMLRSWYHSNPAEAIENAMSGESDDYEADSYEHCLEVVGEIAHMVANTGSTNADDDLSAEELTDMGYELNDAAWYKLHGAIKQAIFDIQAAKELAVAEQSEDQPGTPEGLSPRF